jgi:hypothetical protein
MRFQYRTVPYRTVPRRDGIEKKRSRAGRDGTVSISCGTRRYAVSDSYTALPCRRKKSFNNDFQWHLLYIFLFVWSRGPNRPKKLGLAFPRQATDSFSLPVPVIHFPQPGLPACHFLRPACAYLSWPVYFLHVNIMMIFDENRRLSW